MSQSCHLRLSRSHQPSHQHSRSPLLDPSQVLEGYNRAGRLGYLSQIARRHPSPFDFYAILFKDLKRVAAGRKGRGKLFNIAVCFFLLLNMSLIPFANASFGDPLPVQNLGSPNTTLGSSMSSAPDTLLNSKQAISSDVARIPLSFEPNAGQADPAVRFLAHTPGGLLLFTPSAVVLAFKEPTRSADRPQPQTPITSTNTTSQTQSTALPPTPSVEPRLVHLEFANINSDASTISISSDGVLPGKVNYFLGQDPSKWHTNLPTYESITYENLYPGITLKYDGINGQLKGTYTVAPGADPNRISWRYKGAERLSIDAAGNLQVTMPSWRKSGDASGTQPIMVTEQAPVAWQDVNGQRIFVTARYQIAPDKTIRFALSSYDHTRPLTIDPYLTYSTYLGGNGADAANGIAVDNSGNSYIVGPTSSTDFPVVTGAHQPANGGGTDAFITKLNATGTALIYSTYLGGSGNDYGGLQ